MVSCSGWRARRHPVYAMIRPRAGDFCFGGVRHHICRDIAAARYRRPARGEVVGLLDEDGRVPEGKLRQLVGRPGPLGVTFHRAIDLSSRLAAGSQDDRRGGLRGTFSGSGHARRPRWRGLKKLETITRRWRDGQPTLMPGGGVNADNVRTIIRFTGVSKLHMSGAWAGAAAWMPNNGVNMGTSDDGRVNITDGARVAAVGLCWTGPDADRAAPWCLFVTTWAPRTMARVNITGRRQGRSGAGVCWTEPNAGHCSAMGASVTTTLGTSDVAGSSITNGAKVAAGAGRCWTGLNYRPCSDMVLLFCSLLPWEKGVGMRGRCERLPPAGN